MFKFYARIGAFGLLVVSLMLVACGDTSTTPTAIPVAPITAQASLNDNLLPSGTYVTSLKAINLHPEIRQEFAALRNYYGRWELKLDKQGNFSVSLNNQPQLEGQYSLTDQELSFTGAKWPTFCSDFDFEAGSSPTSYHWHFEGKILTLTGKDNPCSLSSLVLLNGPLTLSEQPAIK